jgi:outer membrane biosynthesis protein TonB
MPPAARARKGGSGARYAIAGVIVAALAGGGYFAWQRFGQPGPSPAASPSVAPTPRPVGTPVSQPTPEVVTDVSPTPMAVVPTPEPSPEPQEVVTIVKPKSPSPSPTAVAAASPSPSPSPSRKPTPAPVATTAPVPSAEAQRAQQVASLLGQAESAVAGQRYDAAVGLFDEVLKLDPQNARAQAGKASAGVISASLKRRFVAGRTVVQGKSSKADLGGFDTSDVKVTKAPDYSGRIDFEVTPSAVKPGDGFTVRVSLTNDGKKGFKVGGLTATTSVNGAPSGGAVPPKVRELEPQQKAVVHEITGTWPEDVRNWSLQVVVTSDHGDTFRNQVNWR